MDKDIAVSLDNLSAEDQAALEQALALLDAPIPHEVFGQG